MNKYPKIGMLLLGVWLILRGIMPLFDINFSHSGTITDILAIAAGILILLANL
jgi:hypothetical protein